MASILFLAMVLIEAFNVGTYLDEIIGVFSLIYIAFFIAVKARTLGKIESVVAIALLLIFAWGWISNIYSGIPRGVFSIIVDSVAETKVMACFFLMRLTFNEKSKSDFIDIWVNPAKLYLMFAFVFGVLTLFVNTGMYSQVRYGIPSFHFFYDHAFQFTTTEILAILFVEIHEYRIKGVISKQWLYVGLFTLGLTTKAPALVYIVIALFLMPYLKKYKHITTSAIAILVVMIVIVGAYQIQNYLLKPDTPRNLFTIYSIKTANEYFPFGSGFATFGSDQAARNYSPLYVKYGFSNMWGLGKVDGWFLSDNFWQCIIAQLGWIGFLIYIIPYILIYKFVGLTNYPPEIKAMIYADIFQFYVHAFGSAILSSASGVIGFIGLGIILCKTESDFIK